MFKSPSSKTLPPFSNKSILPLTEESMGLKANRIEESISESFNVLISSSFILTDKELYTTLSMIPISSEYFIPCNLTLYSVESTKIGLSYLDTKSRYFSMAILFKANTCIIHGFPVVSDNSNISLISSSALLSLNMPLSWFSTILCFS